MVINEFRRSVSVALVLMVVQGLLAPTAHAQFLFIASDAAANYTTWGTTGAGTNFGNWTLAPSGRHTVGTTAIGSKTFSLVGAGGSPVTTTTAQRTIPAMVAGDQFRVLVGHAPDVQALLGVEFIDNLGDQAAKVENIPSGYEEWYLESDIWGGQPSFTPQPNVGNTALEVVLTFKGNREYDLSIGAASLTGFVLGSSRTVNRVRFYSTANAGVPGLAFDQLQVRRSSTFNVASGTTTESRVYHGPSGLVKTGAGTLTITGQQAFTGLTTVSAGTLNLNRDVGTTLPSANSILVNGGTLNVQTAQNLDSLSVSSGTVNLQQSMTAGTLVASGGTINITTGRTLTVTSLTVTNTPTISGSGAALVVTNGVNATAFAALQGFVNGGGVLTLNGSSTLPTTVTISGGSVTFANAVTGVTTLNQSAGTVNLNRGADNTLPNTTAVTVSGGTLNINRTQTFGSMNVSGGTVNVAASMTLTTGTLTVSNSPSFTGTGTISSASTLNSTAFGRLAAFLNQGGRATLSGAITMPASVSISSGTLSLTGQTTGLTALGLSGGTVTLGRSGGATLPAAVALTQSGGTLNVNQNQTLGSVNFTSGTLTVASSRTLTISGAYAFPSMSSIGGTGTVVVSPQQTTATSASGWRLMAAPVAGITPEVLSGFNLVQGVPGGTHASFGANLLTTYTGTSFAAPADMTTALEQGRGFAWYMYNSSHPTLPDERPAGWRDLPVTFSQQGTATRSNVTISAATLGNTTSTGTSFYLLGNPFVQGLRASGITCVATCPGVLSSTFTVWNPGTGSYENRSGTNLIAPWQGFFAQVSGLSGQPSFSFAAASATGSSASLTGKNDDPTLRLDFVTEGEIGGMPTRDEATTLVFAEDAELGFDRHEFDKMTPLVQPFATFAFRGPHYDGAEAAFAVRSLPLILDAPVTLPLEFQATAAGTFRLSWPELDHLPEAWRLSLRDAVTDEVTDLRTSSGVVFSAGSGTLVRFYLTVTPGQATTANPEERVQPILSLNAPAPHPFRVATTLDLQVDLSQFVRATLFDLLGREVSVVYEGDVAAGNVRPIRIDGTNLAPGVYVLRVEGESFMMTRQVVRN